MSWIKENKFLAGFAGVTLVGVGALGFLTLQSKSRYDEALSNYEQESGELNRLQNLQPFPNPENVAKLDEQRKAQAEALKQLQESLSKIELPLEQVSPQQFQDKLRATVDTINQQANEAGVQRAAETANLGFDRYLSEPPRPEAAAALARQLRAIEIITGNLIKNRVAAINKIEREELPEERVNREEPDPSGKPGAKPSKTLVSGSVVQIAYLADQRSALNVLNEIVDSKDQFFIPRLVSFKNEKDVGPARNDPAAGPAAGVPLPGAVPDPGPAAGAPTPDAAAPAAPGAVPAPGTPAAPGLPGITAAAPQQRIIVGEERVEVTIRIEIVDFADSATTASK